MEYLEPAAARRHKGMRLVLTAGVPGPWGEAAKAIFDLKGIAYRPVRQTAGEADPALLEWTGHANAPQAVLDDEPARTGWAEILLLAERLAPTPSLIPEPPHDRALMFGLGFEICGEDGLGWHRRLQIMDAMLSSPGAEQNPQFETGRTLARRYGYSREAASRSNRRVRAILELFTEQLARQAQKGSEYLVGDRLSAVDVYWSTFAAMLRPLPHELCPMPAPMRASYEMLPPEVAAAVDPSLLAHRDRIYQKHLKLPVEF
ncbi:MAG: glutathione binding-like protein [Myxococcota bacterium]